MKTVNITSIGKKLAKNKYVLLVLLLGLILILIPSASSSSNKVDASAIAEAQTLDSTGVALYAEGEKIANTLQKITGVGEAEVLLSAVGAVVVCQGADLAQVRLAVTNAVSSYTGLGCDKITVLKMK